MTLLFLILTTLYGRISTVLKVNKPLLLSSITIKWLDIRIGHSIPRVTLRLHLIIPHFFMKHQPTVDLLLSIYNRTWTFNSWSFESWKTNYCIRHLRTFFFPFLISSLIIQSSNLAFDISGRQEFLRWKKLIWYICAHHEEKSLNA